MACGCGPLRMSSKPYLQTFCRANSRKLVLRHRAAVNLAQTLKMASRGANDQMAVIQRQIQQDWGNREYIEVITCGIKKIADFLNTFGV